jgi:hypothetical protein
MMSGPFPDAASYRHQAEQMQATQDPLHHAVIDLASGERSAPWRSCASSRPTA